jgi:hypothetical protein
MSNADCMAGLLVHDITAEQGKGRNAAERARKPPVSKKVARHFRIKHMNSYEYEPPGEIEM